MPTSPKQAQRKRNEKRKEEAPYDKNKTAVAIAALLSTLPILFTIDWSDHTMLFFGAFVSINTLVRLLFPSSYMPATQAAPGFLYSPILARTLATIGEFAFYHAEALAVG